MIAVNADEKKKISERFPNLQFARTMKQDSKRHHYYMVEDPRAVKMLNRIRYGETQKRKGKVNQ